MILDGAVDSGTTVLKAVRTESQLQWRCNDASGSGMRVRHAGRPGVRQIRCVRSCEKVKIDARVVQWSGIHLTLSR